ncbi:V-type ATP synthase subunit D [Pyrofollis japonicus]|uniref:V-type ATP synthase subunit D n=1 Tax=Pyrofollis japonicus TaxID=3060460 RepID=UPI00295B9A82|nr:V-type ATP synthase subunit D [Pyrofollis japonicus]BEP17157.1 V-type ATP synthase subunit D [Pyrofollis japonicus]
MSLMFGGQRVLPTKINLIRLRRELATMKRIRKVIEEKRDVILLYIRQLAVEYKKAYEEAAKQLMDAYQDFFRALVSSGGLENMRPIIEAIPSSLEIVQGTRILFAVKAPTFELVKESMPGAPVTATRLTPDLLRARDRLVSVLSSFLKVVGTEAAIRRLLQELKDTQRLLNALDYSIIPGYEQSIKYIKLVLDDRMREEVIRLKTMKRRLARMRGAEGLA